MLYTLARNIVSCNSSHCAPPPHPASQGAVLNESKRTHLASRLTPSSAVRISNFSHQSWSSVDPSSRTSLPTSSLGSLPGQHEPTGLARLFASAKYPPNPLKNTRGQRPDQPHQWRPSPKELPGTHNRQRAEQTLALYLTPPIVGQTPELSPTLRQPGGMHLQPPPPPPPPAKTTGNTPQTRPARTSGPPHSFWKQRLSTRSTTNRSIHFSVTSGRTDTTFGTIS